MRISYKNYYFIDLVWKYGRKGGLIMNIYIDESGSINNHIAHVPYFVVGMLHVMEKDKLSKAYKRFISSNYERLLELDKDKVDRKTGKIVKPGGKMFDQNGFKELKGMLFDREMKLKFTEFFSKSHYFNIYYIVVENARLTDPFCENTARAFNYVIRLAMEYFIKNGLLPNEDCYLQLDERNEKTETKYFLENYLNTELMLGGISVGKFNVKYFDSKDNKFIQIADVFSNLYYSQLQTGKYTRVFDDLKEKGMLKFIFKFPV